MHICCGETVVSTCGCVVEKCKTCGVYRSLQKCEFHLACVHHDSRKYYLEELEGLRDGVIRNSDLCNELLDAIKVTRIEIPSGGSVLDIGAGIGHLAPIFLNRKYDYEAIEPDIWASTFIAKCHMVPVHNMSFEDFGTDKTYDVVTASHCLEHFKDAPAMLQKMFTLLKDEGYLIIVVPNDRDLWNPDHYWFFNVPGLTAWLAENGFSDIRTHVRENANEREDFIYCVARRGF